LNCIRGNMMKVNTCCGKCGKEKYNIKFPEALIGITMRKGICPFCQEEKYLVPAHDWKCAIGESLEWD
jgi:uncharacterized Fe-S cluster-containing protein